MITVACVWVRANVPYGIDYVKRLRNMVARHLHEPHRFVCLTNQSAVLERVEFIPIPHDRSVPGWWAKLRLFDRQLRGSINGRVLYLDLDSIVVGSLEPVLRFPARFALLPDGGSAFRPRTHRVVKRFNSSVMVWDAGACDDLFDLFRPQMVRELWGDQDWIGQNVPTASTLPLEWFPRVSELEARGPSDVARVVLCKKPKNLEAASRWKWAREAWV